MKIHEQARIRAARADAATQQIRAFREYLHSPKFSGFDPRDGEPLDYIRRHEVLAYLRALEDTLTGMHDGDLAEAGGASCGA